MKCMIFLNERIKLFGELNPALKPISDTVRLVLVRSWQACSNSTGAQIIGEALSQFLREQCGQIRAADSDIPGGGIQRKVAVGQVLLDIFACGLYILVAALTVLCVDAEKKLLQIGENLILLRDA